MDGWGLNFLAPWINEHLVPLIIVAAFLLSLHKFLEPRRTREKMLKKAVWHHAKRSLKLINDELSDEILDSVRKRIQEGESESYTPYMVPFSPSDEITYEQVIEVMGYLSKKDGKSKEGEKEDGEKVLDYFYSQSSLYAMGRSFDSDFVRSWAQDRKLKLWEKFEFYTRKTSEHAEEVEALLDDTKDSG